VIRALHVTTPGTFLDAFPLIEFCDSTLSLLRFMHNGMFNITAFDDNLDMLFKQNLLFLFKKYCDILNTLLILNI